jgi:hypothetical protein
LTIGTWRWQACQLYAPAAFPFREIPFWDRKDQVNENSQITHR